MRPNAIKVENPRLRVPVYLIVDDGAPFLGDIIVWEKEPPDFAEYRLAKSRSAGLARYVGAQRFLEEFIGVAGRNGIEGKLSILPYVPGVGLLDRLPAIPEKPIIENFVRTVRDELAGSFDITPEIVTHDKVLDLETGRFLGEKEWLWCDRQSAETLEKYIAFAIRVLKNCGLEPDGVTSPCAFGARVEEKYVEAIRRAEKEVNGRSLAWYFLSSGLDGFPRLMYFDRGRKEAVVSVVQIISDIGMRKKNGEEVAANADGYVAVDGKSGYLADLMAAGSPLPLCMHWWMMYSNGKLTGLKVLDEVAGRVNRLYGEKVIWMKCSDLARYYAAADTCLMSRRSDGGRTAVRLDSPFSCRDFTFSVAGLPEVRAVGVSPGNEKRPAELKNSGPQKVMSSNSWFQDGDRVFVCLDLEDTAVLELS